MEIVIGRIVLNRIVLLFFGVVIDIVFVKYDWLEYYM